MKHVLLLTFSALLSIPLTACATHNQAFPSPAKKAKPPTMAQAKNLFTWFDSLGFPKLAGKKFVRVATGNWFQAGNDPRKNRYLHGFLLRENGKRFTVLTMDLTQNRYEKTRPATPEYERVDFEVIDLQTYAKKILGKNKKDGPNFDSVFFGISLGDRAQLLVFARACAAAGHHKLAHDLVVLAATMPRTYGDLTKPPPGSAEKLKAEIEASFSYTEMWRAVVDFGDPKVSRKQLLKRFQKLVKNFPRTEYTARARKTARLLAKMVKEDEAHAAKKRKPLTKMSVKEHVAELIFQLRDQNGHQYMQPGACDIFDELAGKDDTAAHKLVKLGYDAIPQLIEHLDDERFTRSVGYHRNFYFSHHVLRVSDCAQAIIARIASRNFYTPRSGKKKPVDPKAAIRKWWAEIQKKGEKQVLIEATESGEYRLLEQADLLAKKYPNAALPAIKKGLRNAKDEWARSWLIRTAATLKGKAPVAFLLNEMKNGPSLVRRVTAADELFKRKHPAALPAMLQEWQRVLDGYKKKASADSDLYWLIEFLAGSRNKSAIQALAKDFHRHAPSDRVWILQMFDRHEGIFAENPGSVLRPDEPEGIPKEIREPVEKLIATALPDSTIAVSKFYGNASIGEVAAYLLATHWPKKYRFNLSAPWFERERQQVVVRNVWRKARNLPPLPVPQQHKIKALPPETVGASLDKILSAKSAAERKRAVQVAERLGIAALPRLNQRLSKLKKNNPARADLQALAARLSCTVTVVALRRTTAKASDGILRQAKKLKTTPLTADGFVDLLVSTARKLPKGTSGVELVAYRRGDDNGITLGVTLFAGDTEKPASQWDFTNQVDVGKKTLTDSFGAMSADSGTTKESHAEFRSAIQQALSADPAAKIFIRARLVRH